ncbi:hypothetical protein [Bryobacter aggregatus]|uniref:hypothetical protein n=1 Tax=Bryobacter aggregatus TaxID=360054 RepID=UPI0004E1A3D6|nr:hypothetical protein [Bryobacter aggregatus]
MKNRRIHNWRPSTLGSLALLVVMGTPCALAYPPAVGILSPSRNCLSCHKSEGPWKDSANLIIDILDKSSGKSLKQEDGTFLISAKRGELKTVLTVIGWKDAKEELSPYRNAWIYVDPKKIPDPSSLNKFAPGWMVNLPASCRIVGDTVEAYAGAQLTSLPMTLRAGDDASDAEIELQVMLTRGESVKGDPKKGMLGNYFARRVHLKVE